MSGLEIIELENKSSVPKEVDNDNEKWQKLVLYYLARLKGLCDWRNNSRSKVKPNPKINLKRCTSQELETRIIGRVTHKSVASRKQNNLDTNDIGCYMAAGYEEGKQQAVKIISRSLKYGVMTGILLKRGNCYRVAPEYLCESDAATVAAEKKKNAKKHPKKECDICFPRNKCSVKSVKTNVRKKDKKKSLKKHAIETKKSNVTIKGKKRKRTVNNTNIKKKKVNSATSIKQRKATKRNYDNNSDENAPKLKKNKRSSDTNIHLNESSNSNTSFRTLSRSETPFDDRQKKRDVRAKRPRPKIQNPINYVPPLKKPRTKSQSKSPSHHTDDDEVRDVENAKCYKRKLINKFRMPRPRRYTDVMSSISSSSLSSTCALCEREKNPQIIKKIRRK